MGSNEPLSSRVNAGHGGSKDEISNGRYFGIVLARCLSSVPLCWRLHGTDCWWRALVRADAGLAWLAAASLMIRSRRFVGKTLRALQMGVGGGKKKEEKRIAQQKWTKRVEVHPSPPASLDWTGRTWDDALHGLIHLGKVPLDVFDGGRVNYGINAVNRYLFLFLLACLSSFSNQISGTQSCSLAHAGPYLLQCHCSVAVVASSVSVPEYGNSF